MPVTSTISPQAPAAGRLPADYVSHRLLEIVSDTSKGAQQRISEATAYAGTSGWESCCVFALAPDLIRHVELRCDSDPDQRIVLQILDSEDGQERLQVSYVGPDAELEKIL